MNEKKEALRAKFSADYKHYYLIDLFKKEGFVRRKCENCGRFFWSLDSKRKRCDDQPCSPYTFIVDPPTRKKLDEVASWKAIESFFVKNAHSSVKRYPVVSRWRPDLYFTVASIIDFQRVEAGKVVFLANCAACHTLAAAAATGTVGPNLDDAKPSLDLVLNRVQAGGGAMPSFEGVLSDQQIQDVAAFVAASAGT